MARKSTNHYINHLIINDNTLYRSLPISLHKLMSVSIVASNSTWERSLDSSLHHAKKLLASVRPDHTWFSCVAVVEGAIIDLC